jgi:hypothetical protein
VDERRLWTRAPRSFYQIHGAHRIGIEILKGNGRGAIVRGLAGGVHDDIRLQLSDQIQYPLPVSDIEIMMNKAFHLATEERLVPVPIDSFAEENRPLVVIDPVNSKSFATKKETRLRTD